MAVKLGKKRAAAYRERIERERESREAAEREAVVRAAREREQAILAARQRYEERIRAEALARTREHEERRRVMHEQALEADRQKMAKLRECEQRRANVLSAIQQLSGGDPDLSSPEAALEAAERAARVLGLQQLLEKADAALRQAERAVGRHRIGS